MNAGVCGRCPRCNDGYGYVRALTDSDERVYGFRAICPTCDARTVLASSAKGARKFFDAGRFIAVPAYVGLLSLLGAAKR
jgi:hypothetical protein